LSEWRYCDIMVVGGIVQRENMALALPVQT